MSSNRTCPAGSGGGAGGGGCSPGGGGGWSVVMARSPRVSPWAMLSHAFSVPRQLFSPKDWDSIAQGETLGSGAPFRVAPRPAAAGRVAYAHPPLPPALGFREPGVSG